MSTRHRSKRPLPALTMHGWTAKHYVVTAILVLVVMGMFAYRWS